MIQRSDYNSTDFVEERVRNRHHGWMSMLPDELSLAAVSIPGTHESCSFHGGDMVQTQSRGLKEQLDLGIRLLDIRVKIVEESGGAARFDIYHGVKYQGQTFGGVIAVCQSYLAANRGECVLMRIQSAEKESSAAYYQMLSRVFHDYVREKPSRWYLNEAVPTLGEARGKIVVLDSAGLESASPAKGGIPFPSDGPDIEDHYEYSISDKKNAVRNHLNQYQSPARVRGNQLFFTFCSGCRWEGPWPYHYAMETNGVIFEFVNNGGVGSVFMDFPGDEVVADIIWSNPLRGAVRSVRHGGHGGSAFDDLAENQNHLGKISSITVSHGRFVDSIAVQYKGGPKPAHGGSGGRTSTFTLADDEWLTGISGRSGAFVDQVQFHLSSGVVSEVYGGNGGEPFSLTMGGRVVKAIFGHSGEFVDQLGVHFAAEQLIGGGADQIVAAAALFAINSNDKAVRRYDGATNSWSTIGRRARQLAADGDRLYVISTVEGDVYRYDGKPDSWTKIGGAAQQLAAAGDHLYMLGAADGAIRQYDGEPNRWTKIGDGAKQIVADGDELYAIKTDGAVYRHDRGLGAWQKIGGGANQIAAAGAHLYVLSAGADTIWRYDGAPDRWTKVGDGAKQIVAAGQSLYMISTATNGRELDAIYRYHGASHRWTLVGGSARALAATDSHLYKISATDGCIYWEY